jgi:hypothetical protein
MPALSTLQQMGDLYANQGETAKAQEVYARALYGLRLVLGQSSDQFIGLASKLDALPTSQRVTEEQQTLSIVDDGSKLDHKERKKSLRLSTRKLVKKIF